jgi:hypothetical protein
MYVFKDLIWWWCNRKSLHFLHFGGKLNKAFVPRNWSPCPRAQAQEAGAGVVCVEAGWMECVQNWPYNNALHDLSMLVLTCTFLYSSMPSLANYDDCRQSYRSASYNNTTTYMFETSYKMKKNPDMNDEICTRKKMHWIGTTFFISGDRSICTTFHCMLLFIL